VPFRTPLCVRHEIGEEWRLLDPLVFAFYWLIEWLVAVPWYLFERARGLTTNLPWPKGKKRERHEDPPKEYLLVIPKRSRGGAALAGMLGPNGDKVVPDDDLDLLPTEALASAY
jgi:hypothetical protein